MALTSPCLFFCHRQSDTEDRCKALKVELESRGLDVQVWFDVDQVIEVNLPSMVDGVRQCSGFVLFWSPGVQDSDWMAREILAAILFKKPIARIVEQSEELTATFVKDDAAILKALVQRMRNEFSKLEHFREYFVEHLTMDSLHEDLLKEKLGAPITFSGRRLSQEREIMIASIFDRAKMPVIVAETMRDDLRPCEDECADVFLVGHPKTGTDQCELLANEMVARGVIAEVLYSSDASEFSNWFACKDDKRPSVVIYLTDEVFTSDNVAEAFRCASKYNCRIGLVFEARTNRRGAAYEPLTLPDGMSVMQFSAERLKDQAQAKADKECDPNRKSLLLKMVNLFLNHEAIPLENRAQRNMVDILPKILTYCGVWVHGLNCADPYKTPVALIRKYEENTRLWLGEKVMNELNAGTSIVAIAAPSGYGKSVFMAKLAQSANRPLASRMGMRQSQVSPMVDSKTDALRVAGMYFFHHTTAKSLTDAIQSLCLQLCVAIPGFREELMKSEFQKLIQRSSGPCPAGKLLESLILGPVRSVRGSHMMTIIILDGVDECESEHQFWKMVSTEYWKNVPGWFRLIFSTKSSRKMFRAAAHMKLFSLFAGANENMEDHELFVRNRVGRQYTLSDEIILAIVKQSEGMFLWLAYEEKELLDLAESGQLSKDRISNLPLGLEGVYEVKFQSLYEALEDDEDFYCTFIGIAIVAPRESLPESILEKVLLQFGKALQDTWLRSLSALMVYDENQRTFSVPHKSMIDWLTGDEERCARRMPDGDAMHLAVSEEWLQHLEIGCVLEKILEPTLEDRNHRWKDSGDLFRESHIRSLSFTSRYALKHAVYHMSRASRLAEKSGVLSSGGEANPVTDSVRAAGAADSAISWFLDFSRLEWMVTAGVVDGTFSALLMKDLMIYVGNRNGALPWLLQLVTYAVGNNPLELAGQVLARLDSVNDDNDLNRLKEGARAWVDEAVQHGLEVAVPLKHFPGLSSCSDLAVNDFFTSPNETVSAISMSDDGNYVAYAISDGPLIVYDCQARERVKLHDSLLKVSHLQLSADAQWLAVSSSSGVQIFHVPSKRAWKVPIGIVQHLNANLATAPRQVTDTDNEERDACDVIVPRILKLLFTSTSLWICWHTDTALYFEQTRGLPSLRMDILVTVERLSERRWHRSLKLLDCCPDVLLFTDDRARDFCLIQGTSKKISEELLQALMDELTFVFCGCISNDRKHILLGGDCVALFYNLQTKACRQFGTRTCISDVWRGSDVGLMFDVHKCYLSKSANVAVIVSKEEGRIFCWDLAGSSDAVELRRPDTSKVQDICMSGDGSKVLELSNGAARRWIPGNKKSRTQHLRKICDLKVIQDRGLAVSTGDEGAVFFWDLKSGEVECEGHHFTKFFVVDTRLALTSSGLYSFDTLDRLRIKRWDLSTKKSTHQWTYPRVRCRYGCVSFCSSGTRIALVPEEDGKTCVVHQIEDEQELLRYRFPEEITYVSFLPEDTIQVWCDESHVFRWNLVTNELTRVQEYIRDAARLDCVAFEAEGRSLVLPSCDSPQQDLVLDLHTGIIHSTSVRYPMIWQVKSRPDRTMLSALRVRTQPSLRVAQNSSTTAEEGLEEQRESREALSEPNKPKRPPRSVTDNDEEEDEEIEDEDPVADDEEVGELRQTVEEFRDQRVLVGALSKALMLSWNALIPDMPSTLVLRMKLARFLGPRTEWRDGGL